MSVDSKAIKKLRQKIRHVLVRHSIATGAVQIAVGKTGVTLGGELKQLPAKAKASGGLTSRDLIRLDTELRKAVKMPIRYALRHWRQGSGSSWSRH